MRGWTWRGTCRSSSSARRPELVPGAPKDHFQEAVRTGDLPAPGDSGLKLNELYPQRYARVRPRDAAMASASSGGTLR